MRHFVLYLPLFVALLVSSSFHSPRAETTPHSLPASTYKQDLPVIVKSQLDTIAIPDSALIVLLEGCTDTFIVPSKLSGPTISCGVDLNALGADNVRAIFDGLVSPKRLNSIVAASKYRGSHAQVWAKQTHISLSDDTQQAVFRRTLALIWHGVHGEDFSHFSPAVQAALLSYAYHTGHLPADRRKLLKMSPEAIARLLKQRGSSYRGSCRKSFRRRRLLEANFIERYRSLDQLAVRRVTISLSAS